MTLNNIEVYTGWFHANDTALNAKFFGAPGH